MTNFFPLDTRTLEIQVYKKKKDYHELYVKHVAFTGSLQRHPHDKRKIILVTDPFSSNTVYYEFNIADIAYLEELSNLVNQEGDTIAMARIWVKKMTIGVRCSPFLVDHVTFNPKTRQQNGKT